MENYTHSDELQHHGTKGMRWGIRRYQNKDGTLTPAGKKRYNKEVEKLKAEEAKLKEAKRVAANSKRTQTKIDKLNSKWDEIEEQKRALKGKGKSDDTPKEIKGETLEQKRERLLKSTDAKELYKNKDILSDAEINARINRIDLEARLQSKIVEEKQKTGMDYMNEARNKIDAATNLYKSVDNAYSAVANSAIGKTVAKNLGLEVETKKDFDLKDFYKNINKKSDKELQDAANRIRNQDVVEDAVNKLSKGKGNNSDSVDYDDFYKNISTKSDKEVQRAAQRAENEAKILNNKDRIANARKKQDEEEKEKEEEKD